MPMRPPIEELLTMAPLPCSRIWRSSYFMQFQTPRRLIPFTRSNSSPLTSAISTAGDCMPALLNAASRRPKVDTVCVTIAATSASSATLQRIPIALCPAATSSSAAERTAFSLTSASATAAPASAKALAVTSPMPEAAPVTRATLFSKDIFITDSSLTVLFVADFFHPVHDLAFEGFLNGDMSHGCGRRSAMPMLQAGREPDHIARTNFLDQTSFALHPTQAGGDNQRLTQRMGVPCCASPRLERDTGSRCARGCMCLEQRIYADCAGKPIGWSFAGRL